MSSDQDFTLVKTKNRFKGVRRYQRIGPSPVDCKLSPDRVFISKKILECRLEIKKTSFFEEFLRLIQCQFPLSREDTVICYGIGHIGSCRIALHQFGLLIELMTFYQISVTVYDPVLHEEEKYAILEAGCQIAPRNEMCKHRAHTRTLFFMPHCGKAMYNNVLWANWSCHHLHKIGIIGNSFSSYHDKYPIKQLSEEAPYIYRIHRACLEHPLPTTYPDSTVFNDTSLHLFKPETISTFPQDFWLFCPEPVVDSSDTEIISAYQV